MTVTKTVTWETKDGKEAKVVMERTLEVTEKVAYADGYNIPVGKKLVDLLELRLILDGKQVTSSHSAPTVLSSMLFPPGNLTELKAAGAYAQLGRVYINQENYNRVMAAIKEAEEEIAGGEGYAEVVEMRAMELVKEAERAEAAKREAQAYDKMVKSGLCPHCGTWCYGDCGAN